MGIILASLLFGIISAMIAHSKARHALGWFIAGCLVGPFALLVALLPIAIKEGITRKCPECSETIREDARICRYCQSVSKEFRAA